MTACWPPRALGGPQGQGQLLTIWERWLLGLADADIELGGPRAEVKLADAQLQAFAATLGTHADRWFASLLLGLAALSPRIDAALAQVEAQAPAPPPKDGDDGGAGGAAGDDVLGEGGSLGR